MFHWKNICICAATARMWIIFHHLYLLLTNFIHLMQNSKMHFENTNYVLLIHYYRFYLHLRSEKPKCTNKNVLLIAYFQFVRKGIQIWQFMSIKEILLWILKYENLDLFKFFVIEVIWINLWLVDYYLIRKWHLPKYPPKYYENYLPIRYFYLCNEASNCTNLNKTCNIDLQGQYLYSKMHHTVFHQMN